MSNAAMPMYRVNLVEDDPEVNKRLAELIEAHPNYTLTHNATTLSEGKMALASQQPDILLVDLGLPDGSGIELIKAIHLLRLDTQAMVISGFHDEHTVFQALEAGAQGYLLKYDDSQAITDCLQQMLEGGAPMSAAIARLMLNKFQTPKPTPLPEVLTERQQRILKYISQGFSSQEIAEKLNIRYYTVTTHIKNIYSKLQVNSRTEALQEAHKLGLLERG